MAAPKLSVVVDRSTTPPDQQRDREIAFQNWLASTETAFLECRNGRHIVSGLTDQRTKLEVRQGVCHVESVCPRCGTTISSMIGVKDGYLVGASSRARYQYPDGYLLPKEAVGPGGHAMDREHKAQVRLEAVRRGFKAKGIDFDKEVAKDARNAAARKRRAENKPVSF